MANTIRIKRSSTALDVPTAGQMVEGELAVNTADQKLYSKDASTVFEIGSGGIADIVEDLTPELGGDLDINSKKIVSTSSADIDIEPNGTGNVLLGNLEFDADQTVGAGQDNYVLTYDNADGEISLEAGTAGGGVDSLPGMFIGSGSLALANSAAWKTMDLTTETYDPDSNYTIASDIITVSGGGYYLIAYVFNFHPTGGATNDSIGCKMTKNGISTNLAGSENRTLIYKANTRPSSVTCTFIALLAANDTIRLRQNDESGTSGNQVGTKTYLSIMKIRDA